MRHQIVQVKNVRALSDGYNTLVEAGGQMPRLGLVHGFTGAGKTTAIAWHVGRVKGVFLRANAMWTPTTLLRTLLTQLKATEALQGSEMLRAIVHKLGLESRPVFIDEADYLFHNPRMLDVLKDIHDLSGVPILLVGLDHIDRKIARRAQIARRIGQEIEFEPLDLADTRQVADAVCETKVADDLLESLHAKAKGSIGLITVGLARIEALARANKLDGVDAKRWGKRELFLAAGAPVGATLAGTL